MRQLDPAAPDPAMLQAGRVLPDADDQVRELAEALERHAQRLGEFVSRERDFTRDVSHELRNPLTVIRVAASALEAEAGLSESGRRALARIARAARDMEEPTSAFLLLARDAQASLPLERVCLNDLVVEGLQRARLLAAGTGVTSGVAATHVVHVEAPERVLGVLLGNLVRNAFSYTDAGT